MLITDSLDTPVYQIYFSTITAVRQTAQKSWTVTILLLLLIIFGLPDFYQ